MVLFYLNLLSNLIGWVLGVDYLCKVVEWVWGRGVFVVFDECYLGLGWDVELVLVLYFLVCDGDYIGLLVVYLLLKSLLFVGY